MDRSATAVEPSEEAFSPSHAHRPSMDRVKSLNKMFKGNGSNGLERSQSPPVPNKHQRSESAMSERFRRSGDVHSTTPDSAEDQVRSGDSISLASGFLRAKGIRQLDALRKYPQADPDP